MTRPTWIAPMADPRNEEILNAAFDLFVEKGMASVTMLDVARKATVSKETLYARFDSKEGLYYALLAWAARRANFEVQEYCGTDFSRPVENLRSYAHAILTIMFRPESLAVYRITAAEAAGRNPEIGRALNVFNVVGTAEFRSQLATALVASGEVEIDNPEEFFDCFAGLLRGNRHHNTVMGAAPIPSAAEIADRSERVVSRLLAAFAPRTAARFSLPSASRFACRDSGRS
jgi:TetR/AcrR family transcriptional regulator, mexJK operon transcriptional repressor